MSAPSQTGVIVVLTAAVLAAQIGCGRKTLPRPAVEVLPETITDLEALATPVGTQLSWRRPTRYTGGDRMRDLAGFLVQRADAAGAEFQTVGTLEVTDRERFQQTKRFRHLDGTAAADREYLYRVVSFTLDRYFSAPSNIATVRSQPRTKSDATDSPAAPE